MSTLEELKASLGLTQWPTTFDYEAPQEEYTGQPREEMLRILGLMRPKPPRIISPTEALYEREPVLTAEGLKHRIKGFDPLTEEEYGALPPEVKKELEAFFGELPTKEAAKLKTPSDVTKIEEKLASIKYPSMLLDLPEILAGGAVGLWKTPLRIGAKTIAREFGAEITMGASELIRAAPKIAKGVGRAGRVLSEEIGAIGKGRGEEGFIDISGEKISRAILAKSRELQERSGIRKYIIPRVDDLDKETRMIFLTHRARMAERRGDVAKAVKPLTGLDEDELNFAYKWLTIENDYRLADELGIPHDELYMPKWKPARDAATKVRRTFMDLGLEATETPGAFGKALLKEDTYQKNLATYMPDMAYVKEYPHLFGPDILDLTNATHLRKFRTDLSRFMKNKNIIKRHKEEMLQITDVRYLSSKGLLQVTSEIETAKLYNRLEEIPGNVFDDLEAFESFQNQFRESFNKAGINIDEGLRKVGIHRDQFTRVPNEPEYLGLAGKMVRKDIGDTLADMRPEMLGKISKLMDNFLNPWRIGKVVLRTSTHGRNLLSNLILNDIGGLPFYRMDVYGRALSDLMHQGKYYKIAREKGLLLPTFAREEMGKLHGAFNEKEGLMSVFNKIVKPATDLYQAEEQWFKLAKFMHHMEHDVPKGRMDVDEAILAALESTFDYGTRAKGQAAVRRWAMPFATWTYKMGPYLARKSVEHPLRVGKWLIGLGYASQYSAEKVLGSKEEWRELYKRLPEYYQGKNFMLLPFRDKTGRLQMLDLTYMLPWGDVAEIKSEGLGRMLQNPIIATLSDLQKNRDFADREIVPSYDQGEIDGYLKQAFHVYRAMTPSGFPGNYDWDMIAKTIGQPGEVGVKTPAQATMAMMGLKVTPRTEQDIKLSHLRRHEVERNKLIGDWDRAVEDEPRSYKISEINRKYLEKLNKLDDEHLEQLRYVPEIKTPAFVAGEAKRFIIP